MKNRHRVAGSHLSAAPCDSRACARPEHGRPTLPQERKAEWPTSRMETRTLVPCRHYAKNKSATRSRNQPQMKDAMRWLSRDQKSSLKHVSLLQESSRCPLMKTRLSEQNCRTPKHMTTCNVFVCRCLTLVDFSKIQNSNVLMVLASSIE